MFGGMKDAPDAGPILLKKLRVRDIPTSWNVRLPGGPDAPLTVLITPGSSTGQRPLASFVGAGAGLFGSTAEVDAYIRDGRDAWET